MIQEPGAEPATLLHDDILVPPAYGIVNWHTGVGAIPFTT